MASSRNQYIFTLCCVMLLLLTSVGPASGWTRRNTVTGSFIDESDSSGDGDGEDGDDVPGDGGTDDEIFSDMNDSNYTVDSDTSDDAGQPRPRPYCQHEVTSNASMACDFSNIKGMVKLPDSLQEIGIRELEIIGASDLDFQPLCLDTINFNHCTKINHIDYGHESYCHHLLRINIYNSTVKKLAGKYKSVDIFQSNIYHLDIAFSPTDEKLQHPIQLWNAVVNDLSKLTVAGSRFLQMHSIVIGTLHEGGLTINTLSSNYCTLRRTSFSSVETGGILVKEGVLIIENSSINNLAAGGIKVSDNGSLIMRNMNLQNTHPEGLVLETGGRALLDKITLEGSNFVNRESQSTSVKVYPFIETVVNEPLGFAKTPLGIFVISMAVVLVVALFFCAWCILCGCPDLRKK